MQSCQTCMHVFASFIFTLPCTSFTTNKLFTPTNLYIIYQCSTRYIINIIMTILGHHQRASHTPCLLGLIPKGRTNLVSLGTKTQGQDQPHTPTSECLPRGLQGLSPKDPRSHINNISKDNACSIAQILPTNQFFEYHL